MLKLYYAPGTCALASHIALEEAGANYETVRLNFKTEDQKKPDYLKINPKARVPSLVTDRGIITETPAILIYIAQTFPAAKLAPLDDPFALAKVQAFNSYLCSTVHVAHAHRMRGYRWTDDAAALETMKKKVPQTVGECFALIEREMFEGPWVMGKDYTVCDGICSRCRNGSAPTASTSTRRRRSRITSSAWRAAGGAQGGRGRDASCRARRRCACPRRSGRSYAANDG